MSKNKFADAIHTAVTKRDLPEVRSAIANGSAVDNPDRGGRSALFYAAQNGDAAIIDELIKTGANVNARDAGQETPLHFAARSYQAVAAELLLKAGAVVDSKDTYGNTPLWRAVFESRGRGDVIRLLISSGADKDLKNNSDVSPQDLASSIANYRVSELLL